VIAWLAGLSLVVLYLPNSNQILDKYQVVLTETWDAIPLWQERFTWKASIAGMAFTAIIFCASAVLIPRAAQFIYYRF
jgi:hypothetical protein